MKAKIIQSGFYTGSEKKFVCLNKDRDILTFDHVVKDPYHKNDPLCFKVKRGSPWNDKYSINVYLRFDDYTAIN
jgi:hypothetical protein